MKILLRIVRNLLKSTNFTGKIKLLERLKKNIINVNNKNNIFFWNLKYSFKNHIGKTVKAVGRPLAQLSVKLGSVVFISFKKG